MKKIVDNFEYYKGIDIVKPLININQKYSTDKIKFEHGNMLTEINNSDNFDVIFCRDTLVHFNFDDVKKILNNFKLSGIKYLLMTHYKNIPKNLNFAKDREYIVHGMWHPINFTLEPFNLENPIESINEFEEYNLEEVNYTNNDKTLSLWKIN